MTFKQYLHIIKAEVSIIKFRQQTVECTSSDKYEGITVLMSSVLKRLPNQSPRTPSSQNVSPDKSTSNGFKTPMSFTPREAPSPSRKELWKRELGFDDIDVDPMDDSDSLSSDDDEPEVDQNGNKKVGTKVEIEALELELERRERQKEEILAKLKESADKIKSYKNELERVQEARRNQLKIMKKTYETHLREKEDTIQSLHELIEEQDSKIVELHSKLVGESSTDEDSEISVYRSVKKLVGKLGHLQHEKANLTSSFMKTQERMKKIEEENEEKMCKVENERKEVEKEKRKLEKEIRDLKAVMDNGEPSPRNKEAIEKLEKENRILLNSLSDMESELNDHKKKNMDWEHKFEHEVSSLRNSIRQTEAKYAQAAATPPKTIVKTVVPEENIRKIEYLETANRSLERQIASLKERSDLEVSSLNEELKKIKDERAGFLAESKRAKSENVQLNDELERKKKIEALLDEKSKKIDVLQSELKESTEKHKTLEMDSALKVKTLQDEMVMKIEETRVKTEEKYSAMMKNYREAKRKANELESVGSDLRREVKRIKKDMNEMASSLQPTIKDTEKAICKAINDIDSRSKMLTDRYRRELKLRKKYFNELVELKGNIRVFCRVRPTIKEDGSGDQSQVITDYDSEDDGVIYVEHRGNTRAFEVDKVFRPSSTQTEVFNEVQSLITSCIDGYNVCIFAYGQTGSGKTYTMEGTPDSLGINPRALRFLFEEVADRVDWEYSLSVSLIEIYNETLKDLLNVGTSAPLEIKQGKDGVFVPGLQEIEVNNVDNVNEVFALGHKNRATASTSMNEYSSRSHAILQINIVGTNKNTGTQTFGKLNLVDLAGSERVSKSGAEGARMKEAQNINKSLSSLGDVIQSLKMKNSHIPYRNSKLTYLLQNSLGGDSKTLMVVQVAPVKKNAGETFCSLDFASRVRNVELGQATRKVEGATSPSSKSDTPKSRAPKKRT